MQMGKALKIAETLNKMVPAGSKISYAAVDGFVDVRRGNLADAKVFQYYNGKQVGVAAY
jgi:hypothetical protein